MHAAAPQANHSQTLDLSPPVFVALMVVASLLFGYVTITYLEGGIGDEDVHRFQINWFIQGRFEIFKYVTMIPLYHALVAGVAKLTGLLSLDGLRFVHMLLSSLVVPAMYRLVRSLYPQEVVSRTLLLVFIPFFFPLFFVTYTDPLSLAVVLFMLERAWEKHYFTAGAIAVVAVLTRQTNIVWVVFAMAVVVVHQVQIVTGSVTWRSFFDRSVVFNTDFIKPLVTASVSFVPVIVGFLLFVVINGGVAVGDAEQHQITLNLSNLYFFLLVAFALFLPFNIEQLPSILRLIRQHLWVLVVVAAAFVLYYMTFGHPHKYNATSLVFYRHNLILHYVCDFTVGRVLAFIPIAWMALTLVVNILEGRYRYYIALIMVFALLSIVPLPLIEQRYYLVTLALLLAFRPAISAWSTALTLLVFITGNAYILFHITHKHFFL